MPQYIGFKLKDNEFTIPILKVREIINTPAVTKLPHSPHYLRGIINLRGNIVPVVDLRELVSMAGGEGGGNKIIVVSAGAANFGILVDEITSVVNIAAENIEPPEGFMQDAAERIEGVAKLHDRLLILLDTDKLVDAEGLGGYGAETNAPAIARESFGEKPAPVFEAPVEKPQPPRPDVSATVKADIADELHKARTVLSQRTAAEDGGKGKFIEALIEMIDKLAAHDYDKADALLNDMMRMNETELYKDIGMVTRKLHDSIQEFKSMIDPRLKQIADEEVPQAVDSLQYVVEKTEEAANRTLVLVEKNLRMADELSKHAAKIKSPKEAAKYLNALSGSLKKDLNEIMLAQEYQDITGQSIKRVIDMVNTIEAELIGLITHFGVKGVRAEEKKEKIKEKFSQNDIDDLLKEFGF